jgi:DNA-binding response OmpR family regulator
MANGPTVLVVEDDEQWQTILSETLADEGYHVTVLGSYQQSREALETDTFDLVIVDLELDPAAPRSFAMPSNVTTWWTISPR